MMITTSTDRGPVPGCWTIDVPVVPVPASRPRVTRYGRAYYGKRYTQFRKDCTKIIEDSQLTSTFPLTGPLVVSATFVIPRPKTTKREYPRGDVDNYFKTLDVFNEVLWKDDDQILWGSMGKVFGDVPKIQLEITEIERLLKT